MKKIIVRVLALAAGLALATAVAMSVAEAADRTDGCVTSTSDACGPTPGD